MDDLSTPSPSLSALNDPAIRSDPYPLYRQFREAAPIFWDADVQQWVVTRYADVRAILHDPRFSAQRIYALGPAGAAPASGKQDSLMPLFTRQMVFLDPPDHTRLRGLVSKVFTPRKVETLRAHIQGIVDELLDAVLPAGQMDFVRDFAEPLPVMVIAGMLGMPPGDRERLRRWANDVALLLGGIQMTLRQALPALRGTAALRDYIRDLVANRREQLRDDLISGLVLAEEEGDKLSEEELLANTILLLTAGNETTTNFLGTALLTLLQTPTAWSHLSANPQLLPVAIEELLRYQSPLQITARQASADLALGGQQIAQGQFVNLMLGAANRDPARFSDPDRLDLAREDNRHLTFGHAAHFCLGAPLARLEAQVALETLLRRLPNPQLTGAPLEWQPNPTVRGLKSLPLSFSL